MRSEEELGVSFFFCTDAKSWAVQSVHKAAKTIEWKFHFGGIEKFVF